MRLSFGRSSSVGGGVRKLGLGVAGTGGVSQQIHWVVASLQALVGYFEQRFQEFQEKNEPSYF